MHLQLQSAKLMPLGLIDESTIEWEELKKSGNNYLTVVDASLTSLSGSFVDQDVALTGVEMFSRKTKGILGFRIIGHRFDFGTGRLGLDEISKNLTGNPIPLAAINILKVQASDHYTLAAVSLDYRRLLEVNVVPHVHQLTSGSAKKIYCLHFLLIFFQLLSVASIK